MTLVSIVSVNQRMSTIILKQFPYVHRLDRHITDSIMQNFTDVDRRMLYVNGWTPLAEPHICKNILQISHRANSQFQMRKL